MKRPNSNAWGVFDGVARRARFILVAALLVVTAGQAFAQNAVSIRSALIYNFAKFTEWPAGAFASDNAPITVAFVSADEQADNFEKNITGKNVNGRDFVIKKLAGAAGAENCQIVFVGGADQSSAVVAAVRGKPILTVGEGAGFAAAGGMIIFVEVDGKINFDLDLGPVNSGGLKLGAKLQQVAHNVKGG